MKQINNAKLKYGLLALAVGIMVPLAVYANCNNMIPDTQSHDSCSNCDTGSNQNEGGSCSYQTTTVSVFCNCGAGNNCQASAYSVGVILQNMSGTCINGVCGRAVFIENSWGSYTTKFSTGCQG